MRLACRLITEASFALEDYFSFVGQVRYTAIQRLWSWLDERKL